MSLPENLEHQYIRDNDLPINDNFLATRNDTGGIDVCITSTPILDYATLGISRDPSAPALNTKPRDTSAPALPTKTATRRPPLVLRKHSRLPWVDRIEPPTSYASDSDPGAPVPRAPAASRRHRKTRLEAQIKKQTSLLISAFDQEKLESHQNRRQNEALVGSARLSAATPVPPTPRTHRTPASDENAVLRAELARVTFQRDSLRRSNRDERAVRTSMLLARSDHPLPLPAPAPPGPRFQALQVHSTADPHTLLPPPSRIRPKTTQGPPKKRPTSANPPQTAPAHSSTSLISSDGLAELALFSAATSARRSGQKPATSLDSFAPTPLVKRVHAHGPSSASRPRGTPYSAQPTTDSATSAPPSALPPASSPRNPVIRWSLPLPLESATRRLNESRERNRRLSSSD